jgi:hypothetical protein
MEDEKSTEVSATNLELEELEELEEIAVRSEAAATALRAAVVE